MAGLKGLNFKGCDDVNFLPLRLDISADSIRMISMDKERTAVYTQSVELDTQPFSLVLPLSIIHYLISNVTSESISIYISEYYIYFFIDNVTNWWEVSVPLVAVDTEISDSMESLSDIIDSVKKQKYDFSFKASCSDVKDALDSVLVLGEDKKSSDVTLEVFKSKSVIFSLKSYKGNTSVEINASEVSVDNNKSVLVVAKFLRDFINLYPGEHVKVTVIGDKIKEDFSSVALIEGIDYNFVYMFPIGM